MCPAKTQISLCIRPVWSESSLSACRNTGPLTTYWVKFLIRLGRCTGWSVSSLGAHAILFLFVCFLSCCGSCYFLAAISFQTMSHIVAFIIALVSVLVNLQVSTAELERSRTACYKTWKACDWGQKITMADRSVGCTDLCMCWGYVSGRCVRSKSSRCPRDELNLPYYTCECQGPKGKQDPFWCRRGG